MRCIFMSIILACMVAGCRGHKAGESHRIRSLSYAFYLHILNETLAGDCPEISWNQFIDQHCSRVDSSALLKPSFSNYLVLNPSYADYNKFISKQSSDVTAMLVKWSDTRQGTVYFRIVFGTPISQISSKTFHEQAELWDNKNNIPIIDISDARAALDEAYLREGRYDVGP